MELKATQKFFLGLACLSYVGFLVSFVRTLNYGVLGFGILMGVLFLLCIIIGLPRDRDSDDDEDIFSEDESSSSAYDSMDISDGERVHVNSLIDQLAERREDLEAAQSSISDRDKEIDRLKRMSEDKRAEYENLESQKSFLEEKVASLEEALAEANARIEAGETQAALESILPDCENDPPMVLNIGECIANAAEDLKSEADSAGVSIKTITTDATLMVKASRVMVDILFKNIIDNAIKYMNKEGTLQITISRIEQELFIVMKDNGSGLDTAETEHIFELNYQGSNRISGNGLGLAQARAIVEYYGGMIYARSSRGNGMGIYIHLPSAV